MRAFEYEHSTALPAAFQLTVALFCGLTLSWLLVVASIPIFLAAFAGMVWCLLFLQRPDLGLLGTLLVRASSDLTVLFGLTVSADISVSFLTPNAGLILTLIACGAIYIVARGVPVLSLPGGLLIVLLQLAGLVAMLRSEHVVSSLNEWLAVVSTVVVYALAAFVFRTPRQVQRVIDVLAVSFVLPVVFSVWELANWGITKRVWGTSVDAPSFSMYLVLILLVFLGQSLAHSGARRLLATIIVIASAVLLIGTFTRGAWVAALIGLFIITALRRRTLLAAALIVVTLGVRLIPAVGARLAEGGGLGGGSFGDRILLWRSTLDEWVRVTANPDSSLATLVNRLLGLGPLSQPFLTSASAYGGPQIAHNDYLRVFIEYGAFGLAVYILMILAILGFAYRTWQRCTDKRLGAVVMSFVALTVAYSVFSLTDNLFAKTHIQIAYWMLAGLIVAIARMPAQQDAAPPLGVGGQE